MTVESSPALVKSAGQSPAPKAVKLEVKRAFCIGGVRQEVGAVVEVPLAMSRELVGMGKAIAYVAPVESPTAQARRAAGPLKEKQP